MKRNDEALKERGKNVMSVVPPDLSIQGTHHQVCVYVRMLTRAWVGLAYRKFGLVPKNSLALG